MNIFKYKIEVEIVHKYSLLIVIILTLFSCKKEESIALKSAKDFQYKLNLQYAAVGTSPLTKKDFKSFSSLVFFPINPQLYLEAKFIRTPNEKPFEMLTTTSRVAVYVKYGEAHFTIAAKKHTLNIYQNQQLIKQDKYRNHLFLPFTDTTNGKESYVGGRYIDLEKPSGETIIIDFNSAYNPYCAYNVKYSCPIPPKENRLDIAINAGVKKFH